MKNFEIIAKYDQVMETRKWGKEIPYLQFPTEWKIQIIPPFGGATVRFGIKHNNKYVSIYLDCYENLGLTEQPYWEIYPNHEGDNERFYLNETKELLEAITKALS